MPESEPGPSAGSVDPADTVGLVRAAQSGSGSAWTSLVKEYGPRVFALAQSRLGDPDAAEEVTQSVFTTIATKLRDGAYAEHGKFEPWLFRIAMNRVRDRIRSLRRERNELRLRRMARDEAVESTPGPSPLAEAPDLRAAMGRLSKPDREIIELRYHAGLSFKQMAELLEEPIGTLLARHHRALRKLRTTLEASESTVGNERAPQQTARGSG